MGENQVTMLADTGAIALEPWPAGLPRLDEELSTARPQRRVSVTASTGTPADWLRPIVERFQALASLTEDWDGYGSPAPDRHTLINALDVLQRFMLATIAVPAVAPTPTGGVQFEWHQGGWDIEVEVTPSGQAIAWGENVTTGESFHGTVDEARIVLVRTLQRVSMAAASQQA